MTGPWEKYQATEQQAAAGPWTKYATPEQPSMLSRAASAVVDTAAGAVEGAKNLVTGDDRRQFDFPELPDVVTSQGMSGQAMSIGRDDLRKFDILRNLTGQEIPGSIDEHGNVYVTIDENMAEAINAARPAPPDKSKLYEPRMGQVAPAYWNQDIPQIQPGSYYLNRPGASMQDVKDVVTAGAVEAPLAMAGGAGKGLVGIIGAAGGAGAGSAGQDILAAASGARQDAGTFGVDIPAMLMNAGIGGGSEAVARLAGPWLRKLFASGGYDPKKGFTPEAESALKNLGIDPDDLPPEWTQSFARLARENVDPEGAARFADADTLPVKVPLSKGDVSRDVLDQAFESSAGKGSMGRDALDTMESFRGRQQQALKDNAEAIAARVGTGETIPPLSGFQGAQERLAGDATGVYRQAGKLYDEATEMGARVDAAGVRAFIADARKSLQGQFGKSGQSDAMDLLGELSDDLTGPAGAKITKTTIKRLEEFRSAVETQARAAGRDPSGKALRQVKDKLDGFLDDAVENGLVMGETAALDKIKQARGLWRTLKQKYDNDGVVGMLVEFDPTTKTYIPSVEPEAAARTLFNANGVGFKKGANKAASALKDTLGKDSPEWLQLKQEAVMRLLKTQEMGNVRDAAGNLTFSGDKFSTELRKALRESGDLMRTIFTAKELRQLRQFERVALSATNRRSGAVNFSNSGERMLQVMDGFGSQVPGARWLLVPIRNYIKNAGESLAAAQAKDATERGVKAAVSQARRLPAGARGAAAAAGATATSTLPLREKPRPEPQ